jgi:MoaA/NifB/PqqE/SkfB family radical SAM enzyme
MFPFDKLRYIQIEITNNCQAGCPMCPRYSDGQLNPNLVISSWTLDEYKQMFTPEVIKQLEVIEFCGSYGDPVINKDLLAMCEYTKSISPSINITIKTNGSIRTTAWWKELAQALKNNSCVVFALDGLADTNHIYRVGTDFNKIIDNATAFISAGGVATWDMLLFQHNEHQVNEARALSQKLGFQNFFAKASSRFIDTDSGAMFPVKDKDGNLQYNLKPYTNNVIKFPDKDVVVNYKQLVESSVITCRSKIGRELYIDSNKHLYPCCFTSKVLYDVHNGDDFTSFIKFKVYEQFKFLINEIGGLETFNAHTHGIKNILNSDTWQSFWQTKWKNPNKLMICATSCDNVHLEEYSDMFLNA